MNKYQTGAATDLAAEMVKRDVPPLLSCKTAAHVCETHGVWDSKYHYWSTTTLYRRADVAAHIIIKKTSTPRLQREHKNEAAKWIK